MNSEITTRTALLKLPAQILKNTARLMRDRLLLEWLAARHVGCRIDPRAIIRVGRSCKFQLGRNITIGALTLISVEPDLHAEPGEYAILEIGDGTYIGEANNLRAAGGIRIGRSCLISQGVSIISTNHSTALGVPITEQPSRSDVKGVIIEDDVWIGTNVTILPGVTLEEGAIVAAGSVVTKSVPAYTIVAGVPAKPIRTRP